MDVVYFKSDPLMVERQVLCQLVRRALSGTEVMSMLSVLEGGDEVWGRKLLS